MKKITASLFFILAAQTILFAQAIQRSYWTTNNLSAPSGITNIIDTSDIVYDKVYTNTSGSNLLVTASMAQSTTISGLILGGLKIDNNSDGTYETFIQCGGNVFASTGIYTNQVSGTILQNGRYYFTNSVGGGGGTDAGAIVSGSCQRVYSPAAQVIVSGVASAVPSSTGLMQGSGSGGLKDSGIPPASVVTNGSVFNAGNATNINASQLTTGTVPDARLSGNVPLSTNVVVTNTITVSAINYSNGVTFAGLGISAANGNYSFITISNLASGPCFTNTLDNSYQVWYLPIRGTGKYCYAITNVSSHVILYSQSTNGIQNSTGDPASTSWSVVWPSGTAPVVTPTWSPYVTNTPLTIYSPSQPAVGLWFNPVKIDAAYFNKSGSDTTGCSNITPLASFAGYFQTSNRQDTLIFSSGNYPAAAGLVGPNVSIIGFGNPVIYGPLSGFYFTNNITIRDIVFSNVVTTLGKTAQSTAGYYREYNFNQYNQNGIDGIYVFAPNQTVSSFNSYHASSWDSVAIFNTNEDLTFYNPKLESIWNTNNPGFEVHGIMMNLGFGGNGGNGCNLKVFGGSITALNGYGSNTAAIYIGSQTTNAVVELYGTSLISTTTNSGFGTASCIKDFGVNTTFKGYWFENGVLVTATNSSLTQAPWTGVAMTSVGGTNYFISATVTNHIP